MKQTYHVTMDTGVLLDIDAWSAGEAIYTACHRIRGHGVKSCYVGGEHDPATLLLDGEGAGRITFEVPRHDPLPLDPPPGRQRMCARYVRIGDTIEDGVFDFKVHDINETPAKMLFMVREARSNSESELAILKYQIVSIVRGDAAA
jgi:hypothetical protein